MIINCMQASEVTQRIVAIVCFGPPTETSGLRPGEFFQVTIDPKRFSHCGDFIRFGTYPGDEITGWQRADCIFVLSELSAWPETIEELKLTWWPSPALERNV